MYCATQSQVFQHNDPGHPTGDNDDGLTDFDESSSAVVTSGIKSIAFLSTSHSRPERCILDPGTASKLSGIMIWEKLTLHKDRRLSASLLSSAIWALSL